MTAKTRRRIRQAILAAVACVAPFAIGVVPVDAATRSDATATPAPQQVADTACRQAAALEGAGQFTDALKAYEAAIAADPSNACGASGLKALVQGRFAGGQPCTVAAALHRAGDNATAKTILSDAIKSSSTDAVCAAKQLKAINEKSLADRAKSILETVAWCAAILAIPVLLALGILRLFPRPARLVRERISHYLRLHPQLVISDLGDYGGEPKAAATVGALVAARFHSSHSSSR